MTFHYSFPVALTAYSTKRWKRSLPNNLRKSGGHQETLRVQKTLLQRCHFLAGLTWLCVFKLLPFCWTIKCECSVSNVWASVLMWTFLPGERQQSHFQTQLIAVLMVHWEPTRTTLKLNSLRSVSIWTQREGVPCRLTTQLFALLPWWGLSTLPACCYCSSAVIST